MAIGKTIGIPPIVPKVETPIVSMASDRVYDPHHRESSSKGYYRYLTPQP
jgi:hypothetical protein